MTESGALFMFKGHESVWSRSDYLAHVQDSIFVDLPEPGFLSQEHDELGK